MHSRVRWCRSVPSAGLALRVGLGLAFACHVRRSRCHYALRAGSRCHCAQRAGSRCDGAQRAESHRVDNTTVRAQHVLRRDARHRHRHRASSCHSLGDRSRSLRRRYCVCTACSATRRAPPPPRELVPLTRRPSRPLRRRYCVCTCLHCVRRACSATRRAPPPPRDLAHSHGEPVASVAQKVLCLHSIFHRTRPTVRRAVN